MKIQKMKWNPPAIHDTVDSDREDIVVTLCGKWVSVDDYKVVPEDTKITCTGCLNQSGGKRKQK